jgi:hypothetical protein
MDYNIISRKFELNASVSEPGDAHRVPVEGGFSQNRVVAALVEVNDHLLVGRLDRAPRLDEAAVQLLGRGFLETSQLLAQPTVASIGKDGHSDVEVDIESHLARQAIQMKEVHADPQTVFDAVAPRVPDDQVASCLLEVVREKQRGFLPSQTVDGNLSNRSLVIPERRGLIQVSDPLVTALRCVENRSRPSGSRQALEPAENRGTTPTNRDEVDASLMDARHFRVVDELGVEVEPLRVGARDGVPKFDKAHQFSGLISAGQVGVGVAQATAVLFEGKEGLDAGIGDASAWEVVPVEPSRIAPVRNGMEVKRKRVGFGKQQGAEGANPSRQQSSLVVASGPVGVVGSVRLLGEDIQAGKKAQCLVKVKVVDVAAPLLVKQLERQQREESAGSRDHLRARIARLDNELLETNAGKQRQEEKDTGDASPELQLRREV